jgi:hypothetical protein
LKIISYVKVRKLNILMQIGNVFMNDCSSLVASDGNNKVKDLGTDHLNFEWGGGVVESKNDIGQALRT